MIEKSNKVDKRRISLFTTKTLTFCAVMAAIGVVLNYVTTINISQSLRISISGIPIEIIGYMFGPIIGGIFGGTLDIIKFFTKPSGGMFFPGFTFNAMISGVIYGIMLYKKDIKLWRILVANLIVKIIVNAFLGTYWLTIISGISFIKILQARIISNIIMVIIDSEILYFILRHTEKHLKDFFKY